MNLEVMPDALAVCRLSPSASLPDWASDGFSSVTRTSDELSIVCPAANVPEGVRCERGWRGLRVSGPLDFAQVGVLAALAGPLAAGGISIFVISTYDTDYVLVRADRLADAVGALVDVGHHVVAG